MENERAKCFLDTNILIYAYSGTELSKKEQALSLLKEHPISLSTQVINEFLWTMNRKFQVEWDFLKPITDSLFVLYPVTMISESTM